MPADEALTAGVQLLTPLMESHGFAFVAPASGKSSGGWSASGEYRRERDGELGLERHLRHSLGLLTHHVDGTSLSHNPTCTHSKPRTSTPASPRTRSTGSATYCTTSEHYATDFLQGTGDQFARSVQEAERLNALPASSDSQTQADPRLPRHKRSPDLHRPTFFAGDPPTLFDGA